MTKSTRCIGGLCWVSSAEDRVWTVVGHNNSRAVSVHGSTLQRPHVARLDYSASAEQLRVLVGRSEHCQQEVAYRCRKSRLFNTWGKSCHDDY